MNDFKSQVTFSNFFFNLRCPICQSPLEISEKVWQCDGSNVKKNAKSTKHPFDVARQGYVNLLPVQNKKSKNPGDSQDSILARQRFLQTGFYRPLQDCIAKLTKKHFTQHSNKTEKKQESTQGTWLDIGCGEGYYSQKIAEVLTSKQTVSNKPNSLIAIDISKPAVLALAKSCKQQQMLWFQGNISKSNESKNGIVVPLVASASSLPLSDNSIQGVSSIFSPILPDELARVMAQEGILLIAKPDEGHLASVREGLFESVREHDSDKFLEQLEAVGFTLVESQKVSTEFSLNAEQLADLLTMTPYSYRAKREMREALLLKAKEQGLVTEGRFVLYILQL